MQGSQSEIILAIDINPPVIFLLNEYIPKKYQRYFRNKKSQFHIAKSEKMRNNGCENHC